MEQWELVAEKRSWVPGWLYKLYAWKIWEGQNLIPSWVQPLRWILNKEVKGESVDA